jgi:PleD family two-component response regulator
MNATMMIVGSPFVMESTHPVVSAKRADDSSRSPEMLARAAETFGAAEYNHIMHFWPRSRVLVVLDSEASFDDVTSDFCALIAARVNA